MPDYSGVAWTRISGEPVKMGSIFYSGKHSRFSYDKDFIGTNLPGLSLFYPPDKIQRESIIYSERGTNGLIPRVHSLIPPPKPNILRVIGLKYLATQGETFDNDQDENWALLTLTGHGGIGHIDVFKSDQEAKQWYTQPLDKWWHIDDQFSRSMKHMIKWTSNENDFNYLNDTIGPSPAVGGALPKLTLAIPTEGWNGMLSYPRKEFALDGSKTDVIIKFQNSEQYPGLVELEALCLQLHKEAGFNVPRHWKEKIGTEPVLVVERFDRDENGKPIPLESIFSLLATSKRVDSLTGGNLELVGDMILNSKIQLTANPSRDAKEVYARIVISIMTGNGDLHLENLSILGPLGEGSISPVYDPAPMRAYSQHNMLTAIPFGNIQPETSGVFPNIYDELISLGKHFGLRSDKAKRVISDLWDATRDYSTLVRDLPSVDERTKDYLIKNISCNGSLIEKGILVSKRKSRDSSSHEP